ncbi:28S ribosomal protein S15, mitochondrial isoform X1 [Electrophorus electricus]|uniref:28S ribosomal protein S15, mitochondrial isoform X1 n=1 Tax=Electrophorus electricus TaxID=8005 RepID=UPI0015D0743F|nr:28S ribosomal protein S15, mitochondrial isoform X1 [Electrophorus electricus]
MFLKKTMKLTAVILRTWNLFSGVKLGNVMPMRHGHGSWGGVFNANLSWMVTHAIRSSMVRNQIRDGCNQPAEVANNEALTIQPVRHYARAVQKKQEFQSQLQDLPPSMLKLEFATVPLAHTVDDVVKRLLSLELGSHRDKLRLKEEQLIAKVQRDENDRSSTEVKVAVLTARIRNFQEHLQKHPKDKANKRWMLMSTDQRKKLLKFLRRTHYDAFEKVCHELDITYTFPPEYCRRATRRWLAKKALCIKVFKEVQKQKAEQRNKMKQAQEKAEASSTTPTNAQETAV